MHLILCVGEVHPERRNRKTPTRNRRNSPCHLAGEALQMNLIPYQNHGIVSIHKNLDILRYQKNSSPANETPNSRLEAVRLNGKFRGKKVLRLEEATLFFSPTRMHKLLLPCAILLLIAAAYGQTTPRSSAKVTSLPGLVSAPLMASCRLVVLTPPVCRLSPPILINMLDM